MKIVGSIRQRDPRVHVSSTYWLLIFLLQTTVFGLAWWTVFREKRSARVFGIAASMVFILWTLLPLVLPPHLFQKGDLLLLGIGLVGLIAFVWPGQANDLGNGTINTEQAESAEQSALR